MNYPERVSIKSWAEDDRPREKLLNKGSAALSDAELIAILIGSGNRKMSAVELSQLILRESDNNLGNLARKSLHDLMQYSGIGEAKAISIVAALELGRRRKGEAKLSKPKISSSRHAYEELNHLIDLSHEEFWVLLLNRANEVIDRIKVSSGGVSGTVADARLIFKPAIQRLASGVVLAHNHPSGNLKPSQADIDLTKKLKEGGTLIDINIIDHLIVTDAGYYSFADEGML
jgi:DNA repair protein RadC